MWWTSDYNTMGRYNQNAGYGAAILAAVSSQVPTFGRIFVVFNSNDSSSPNYQAMQEIANVDPEGLVRFYTSLSAAYDATTSNNNDVILLDARSTHKVSGMLTISKNRIHFIGMDGGDRLIQQGAKISLTDNAVDAVATLKVTGTRCTFRNLKIGNAGTHTNSVTAVLGDGDEGTLWKNCSFQKTSDLGESEVSDFEIRSDSATFIDCEFGMSTLTITAARRALWIKELGGVRMKDCRFRDCRFTVQSSNSGYHFIELENLSSLGFSNYWIDCIFDATLVASGSAITNAVTSVASLVDGSLCFANPVSFNCTNFCNVNSTQVLTYGPVTSAQGGESGTPA